jgi:hypothetical protein
MSEARSIDRIDEDVREIKATLARLEPMIIRIDERLNSTLPHLATKAELTTGLSELRAEIGEVKVAVASMPSRTEIWGMLGAMTGAFAVILTALTFLQHWLK